MIERDSDKLSISRQCGLLGVSRSTYYHQPKGPSKEDLELMKLIDTEYLKAPFYGSRKMAELLSRLLNRPINRKRVQRFLMRLMGMDWFSRYVLTWRLSNTLEADFCVEALEEALDMQKPDIFNTDQGSQFTSTKFTGLLLDKKVKISMDGKGRFMDNKRRGNDFVR
jgi:putative transposase